MTRQKIVALLDWGIMTVRGQMKRLLVIGLLAGMTACSSTASKKVDAVNDLVFLTRDSCLNTPLMRGRLDEALQSFGLPSDYRVVDSDTLPASDARGGYPTPTLLLNGKDLFGMSEPPTPHDAAT